MRPNNTETLLILMAQSVLRTWNGGNGFDAAYFMTPKGKKILCALDEALNHVPTNEDFERVEAES